MYLVKATNILTNRVFTGEFGNEIEAQEWKQKQIKKESFGKPARTIVKEEESYDPSLFLSEFQDENAVGEDRTLVSLKAEFTIEGPTLIELSQDNESAKRLRMEKAYAKAAKQKKYKEFGEVVQLVFADLISERGFTQEQKDAVQANPSIQAIFAELTQFGRIGKAKNLIQAIEADETLYFQADLDEIIQLITDFLSDNP